MRMTNVQRPVAVENIPGILWMLDVSHLDRDVQKMGCLGNY